VTPDDLRKVEARPEWPTRVTQRIQIFIQNRVISPVLAGAQRPTPPFVVKLTQWFPALQRIPARVIGIGCAPSMSTRPKWRRILVIIDNQDICIVIPGRCEAPNPESRRHRHLRRPLDSGFAQERAPE
jgi:hypothetical protein